MIRRVELRNWRAYDSLGLDLGTGATFVVAKNGIGKTSLIRGIAWALFGQAAVPDPSSAIRGNAETATAMVEFDLPNGGSAAIQREVNVEGSVSVSARTAEIGEMDLAALMVDAFGADESILSRLCVLQEGTVMGGEDTAAGDLSSHLARVFGVQTLKHAASEVGVVEREAERAASKLRSEERKTAAAIATMVEQAAQLEVELAQLETDREVGSQRLRDAQATVSVAEQWSAYANAMDDRQRRLLELLNDSRGLGLEIEDIANIRAAVEASLEGVSDQLEALRQEVADVSGLITTRERQLRELRSSDAVCPICLRPLSLDETERAEREHGQDIQDSKATYENLDSARRSVELKLGQLDQLRNAVASVPTPAKPKDEEPADAGNPAANLEAEQDRLGAIMQEIGAKKGRLDAVREQIEADERAGRVSRRLSFLYRQQALASLMRRTFSRTADELLVSHIDPLATELGARWKSLWSDRPPIHLTPQGRIVSMRAGRSIDYADFSGGERVVAELVLRLLAISMTTRADFLCLDEPLEHLDPRNRRMIASLLVNAASQSPVRQVIATTYEESVARRLSDQSAGTLVYVEGSPE